MLTFKQFNEAEDKEGYSKDRIVYHGTGHNFDTHDDEHANKNRHSYTPEREIKGHYFTSDPHQAYSYASRSAKIHGTKPKVIQAKLHMDNPYDATKDIKKHMKKGMTFSDAKNHAYSQVDRTKHDGIYHRGNAHNHSEFVAFHSHQIKRIVDK